MSNSTAFLSPAFLTCIFFSFSHGWRGRGHRTWNWKEKKKKRKGTVLSLEAPTLWVLTIWEWNGEEERWGWGVSCEWGLTTSSRRSPQAHVGLSCFLQVFSSLLASTGLWLMSSQCIWFSEKDFNLTCSPRCHIEIPEGERPLSFLSLIDSLFSVQGLGLNSSYPTLGFMLLYETLLLLQEVQDWLWEPPVLLLGRPSQRSFSVCWWLLSKTSAFRNLIQNVVSSLKIQLLPNFQKQRSSFCRDPITTFCCLGQKREARVSIWASIEREGRQCSSW